MNILKKPSADALPKAFFVSAAKQDRLLRTAFPQTEADGKGLVDLRHGACIQGAHLFPQSALVDGANLFEQDDRILGQTTVFGIQLDVGGQL